MKRTIGLATLAAATLAFATSQVAPGALAGQAQSAQLSTQQTTAPSSGKLATGRSGRVGDLKSNNPSGVPGRGPDTPSVLPELLILPYYNNPNGLPQGFPTHSYCMQNPAGGAPAQIKMKIRNAGGTATPSVQLRTLYPTSGDAPAYVVPAIPAYGEIVVTKPLPSDCYTPGFSANCQFTLKVDSLNEVAEQSELNNQVQNYCVGPAG